MLTLSLLFGGRIASLDTRKVHWGLGGPDCCWVNPWGRSVPGVAATAPSRQRGAIGAGQPSPNSVFDMTQVPGVPPPQACPQCVFRTTGNFPRSTAAKAGCFPRHAGSRRDGPGEGHGQVHPTMTSAEHASACTPTGQVVASWLTKKGKPHVLCVCTVEPQCSRTSQLVDILHHIPFDTK